MPVVEWNGLVRITVGEMSRASQLDLFKVYLELDEKQKAQGESNGAWLQNLMEKDALVAASATKRIEVCKGGKWVVIDTSELISTPDGDSFSLGFPASYEQVNACPRSLGDEWIKAAVEKNGVIDTNLSFFTSLNVRNGNPNNEPVSEDTP